MGRSYSFQEIKLTRGTNIRSAKIKIKKSSVITISLIAASGCNDSTLDPLASIFTAQNGSVTASADFCTDPAINQKIAQKMVVILDHSGSNTQNYLMASDGSGAPALVNGGLVIDKKYATDPTGHTRYGDINTDGTLLNYLRNLPANDPSNPSLYFALIDFNASATSFPAGNSGFTSDINGFYNHVLSDAGGLYPSNNPPNDSGNTSYLSALSSAYSIINGDVQNAKKCAALPAGSASPGDWCPQPGKTNASYYTIVFMSDGSPITSIGGVGTDANGNVVVTGSISINKEPTSQILGQVGTIMGLGSDTKYVAGMNLYTIYYYAPGNVDQTSQSLLSDMAKTGNGIAYNALSGSNINYRAFLPSTKHIKYTLSDVLLTNSSVVLSTSGQAQLDSDGDGLPDEVEKAWGTNPFQADTFGIGISDLVLYQLKQGQPCAKKDALGLCADPLPNLTTGACKSLTPQSVPGRPGAITYPSSDPSGLNDCEKLALNDLGGLNNPDSNGDIIPDWLELKNGVPFQLGTAPPVNSPGQDGVSIYQKIKKSLPANTPVYQLINPQPSIYDLAMISSSDTQDCYHLEVSNLPTAGDTDKIRIDVILKNSLLQDQKLYRAGSKSLTPGSKSIQFNDWNDPSEIANKTWKAWP